MKYEQIIKLRNGKEALIMACIQCAKDAGYDQLELYELE